MEKMNEKRNIGASTVDAAILAGWEPSEDAKSNWDEMVCEAEEYLTMLYE